MPGRQIIVYDKRRAALEQHTPYWFGAWKIDPRDPAQRVWRVEIRAGRDSWKALQGPLGHRTYERIEALWPRYLTGALRDIRYVTDRSGVSNVTRAQLHPLWQASQAAVAAMSHHPEPPPPPDYVREPMRLQRVDMAMAQGFGNINNMLVLEGRFPETIGRNYARLVTERARAYLDRIGPDRLTQKLDAATERQAVFLQAVETDRRGHRP